MNMFHRHPEENILLDAAWEGNLEVVQRCLEFGFEVNCKDEDGATPVHLAAWKGHRGVCEYLVQHGAEVKVRDSKGFTPLRDASFNGHVDVVEWLLSQGCDVTETDNAGSAPLHMASQEGHIKVVKVLINSGTEVNIQNNNKTTPLHLASKQGHKDICVCLVMKGANMNSTGDGGKLPVADACLSGHTELVRWFLEKGCDFNDTDAKGYTLLDYAIEGGHLDIVQLLIKTGLGVNTKNMYGGTPLLLAVNKGNKSICKCLIENDADMEIRDKNGYSTIENACWNGHIHLVQWLISLGCDVTEVDNEGNTPLHKASQEGHIEIAQALTNVGTKVDTLNKDGKSPIQLAEMNKHTDIVEHLRQVQTRAIKDQMRSQKHNVTTTDTNKENAFNMTTMQRKLYTKTHSLKSMSSDYTKGKYLVYNRCVIPVESTVLLESEDLSLRLSNININSDEMAATVKTEIVDQSDYGEDTPNTSNKVHVMHPDFNMTPAMPTYHADTGSSDLTTIMSFTPTDISQTQESFSSLDQARQSYIPSSEAITMMTHNEKSIPLHKIQAPEMMQQQTQMYYQESTQGDYQLAMKEYHSPALNSQWETIPVTSNSHSLLMQNEVQQPTHRLHNLGEQIYHDQNIEQSNLLPNVKHYVQQGMHNTGYQYKPMQLLPNHGDFMTSTEVLPNCEHQQNIQCPVQNHMPFNAIQYNSNSEHLLSNLEQQQCNTQQCMFSSISNPLQQLPYQEQSLKNTVPLSASEEQQCTAMQSFLANSVDLQKFLPNTTQEYSTSESQAQCPTGIEDVNFDHSNCPKFPSTTHDNADLMITGNTSEDYTWQQSYPVVAKSSTCVRDNTPIMNREEHYRQQMKMELAQSISTEDSSRENLLKYISHESLDQCEAIHGYPIDLTIHLFKNMFTDSELTKWSVDGKDKRPLLDQDKIDALVEYIQVRFPNMERDTLIKAMKEAPSCGKLLKYISLSVLKDCHRKGNEPTKLTLQILRKVFAGVNLGNFSARGLTGRDGLDREKVEAIIAYIQLHFPGTEESKVIKTINDACSDARKKKPVKQENERPISGNIFNAQTDQYIPTVEQTTSQDKLLKHIHPDLLQSFHSESNEPTKITLNILRAVFHDIDLCEYCAEGRSPNKSSLDKEKLSAIIEYIQAWFPGTEKTKLIKTINQACANERQKIKPNRFPRGLTSESTRSQGNLLNYIQPDTLDEIQSQTNEATKLASKLVRHVFKDIDLSDYCAEGRGSTGRRPLDKEKLESIIVYVQKIFPGTERSKLIKSINQVSSEERRKIKRRTEKPESTSFLKKKQKQDST